MEESDFYVGLHVIIGPPGCGKTTFLTRQIAQIVGRYSGAFTSTRWATPVLVCSLTRAAAAEIAGRDIPVQRSSVGTLHSHCFRALNMPTVIEAKHLEEWNEKSSFHMSASTFGGGSRDEADWDVKANEADGNGAGDEMVQELDLLRHRMVVRDHWPREVRAFAEEWEQFKQERDLYDFTDLIEGALHLVKSPPGSPAVIMVDEAQDLSRLEYTLIMQWAEHCSATFIVGDPWQSLYTWRGSDPTIFRCDNAGAKRKILSQSYRVPAAVVHVAREWMRGHLHDYEDIEYKPRSVPIVDESDIPGEVGTRDETMNSCASLVREAEEFIETGRTVMFQASCGYMLSHLISELRAAHLPFANPWRKYRTDWNPLTYAVRGVTIVNRLRSLIKPCSDTEQPEAWTWKDVLHFAEPMLITKNLLPKAKERLTERVKGKAKNDDDDEQEKPAYEPVPDGGGPIDPMELGEYFCGECLTQLLKIAYGEVDSRACASWWWKRLLAPARKTADFPVSVVCERGASGILNDPMVYVGTIHSFKGSEADVVYVFPDLSRAGFREWMTGEGPDRDAVVRTFYVAMTRAREKLFICRNATTFTAPLRREVGRILSAAS